jgi:hypothetical protein
MLNNKSGYVYILSNVSLTCLKIGKSKHPGKRCEQLSQSTAIPTPFDIEIIKKFDNCVLAESILHKKFSDKRVANNREFFNITLEEFECELMKLPSINLEKYLHETNETNELITNKNNEIEEEICEENIEDTDDESNIIHINNTNYNIIKNLDLSYSCLVYCNKLHISERQSYKNILLKIYKEINDISKIIANKNSGVSIFTNQDRRHISSGYSYIEKYNCTISALSAHVCINEIINQCIKSNIILEMKIKLIDDKNLVVILNNEN